MLLIHSPNDTFAEKHPRVIQEKGKSKQPTITLRSIPLIVGINRFVYDTLNSAHRC